MFCIIVGQSRFHMDGFIEFLQERLRTALPGNAAHQQMMAKQVGSRFKPHKSELYRRISIRGGGQMPLVGSAVVDSKGSELIRKWIENLGKQNE